MARLDRVAPLAGLIFAVLFGAGNAIWVFDQPARGAGNRRDHLLLRKHLDRDPDRRDDEPHLRGLPGLVRSGPPRASHRGGGFGAKWDAATGVRGRCARRRRRVGSRDDQHGRRSARGGRPTRRGHGPDLLRRVLCVRRAGRRGGARNGRDTHGLDGSAYRAGRAQLVSLACATPGSRVADAGVAVQGDVLAPFTCWSCSCSQRAASTFSGPRRAARLNPGPRPSTRRPRRAAGRCGAGRRIRRACSGPRPGPGCR